MEILIAFLAGAAVAAVVFSLLYRVLIARRVAQAEESARIKTVSALKIEQVRLEAELSHSQSKVAELQLNLQQTKEEMTKNYAEQLSAKDEAFKETLALRDFAHKEAMEALQTRFDETVAKVSSQVREQTGIMLKERQILTRTKSMKL